MGNKIEKPQQVVTIPHDDEVEKALLSVLINYPTAYSEVSVLLTEDDFFNVKHKRVFDCIRSVSKSGDIICLTSVNQTALAKYDNDSLSSFDIVDISNYCGSYGELHYDCRIVNSMRLKRQIWECCTKAANDCLLPSADVTEITEQMRKTMDDALSQGKEHIVSLVDGIVELCGIVTDNQYQDTIHKGTPTGFSYFDSKGGFQPSDLIILAAESSQGKTSLAMSICMNAIIQGNANIAYYSLEMSRLQLSARVMAMQSGVASNSILYSRLSQEELMRFRTASDNYVANVKGNLYVDDRGSTNLDSILASIRTMVIKYHIDGVVVDFLQRLRPERGMSKEQFIGEAAQRLKDIARELGIWVMALSQLSRDRDNPEPNVNRLRDSGQINEAADVTLLLYRPEAVVPYSESRTFPEPFKGKDTKGAAMITIAKGRNIGTGSFLCGFDAPTTRFYPKVIADAEYSNAQNSNSKHPF